MLRRHLLIPLLVLAAVASACGSDDDGDDVATGDESATEVEATLSVADSSLGSILVGPDDMTLYLFTSDKDGTSTCTGQCADLWPALTVEDEPVAGDGVDAAKLGTSEREDGSTQVTYNGHPLYFYGPDEEPGDVKGQGVGTVWWVVSPDGEPVENAPSSGGY